MNSEGTPNTAHLDDSSLSCVLERIAQIAKSESNKIRKAHKQRYSQYFTEGRIAQQMSNMLHIKPGAIIGDHGAGTGILGASVLAYAINNHNHSKLHLQAYEIDELLHEAFYSSLSAVSEYAVDIGKPTPTVALNSDFTDLAGSICDGMEPVLDSVILNPPYKKLHQKSELAKLMRDNLVATPNLYAVFIVLSIMMLRPGGQIVAIVPRSFTSGSYFKDFRRWLRSQGSIDWFVRYKRRSNLFRGDNVLQENLTFRFTRGVQQRACVRVSLCNEPNQPPECESLVPSSDVFPEGTDMFFVPAQRDEQLALHIIRRHPYTLKDLGLGVTTGKLEDFRYREYLSGAPGAGDWVPVIYAQHWRFSLEKVRWTPTTNNNKPACLKLTEELKKKVIPRGNYVLIKRISANDDRNGRCNVTTLTVDADLPGDLWVIDNHVQVLAGKTKPLTSDQASQLAIYLASDNVDRVLRLVSGTTQINKDDLEQLRFPSHLRLENCKENNCSASD